MIRGLVSTRGNEHNGRHTDERVKWRGHTSRRSFSTPLISLVVLRVLVVLASVLFPGWIGCLRIPRLPGYLMMLLYIVNVKIYSSGTYS